MGDSENEGIDNNDTKTMKEVMDAEEEWYLREKAKMVINNKNNNKNIYILLLLLLLLSYRNLKLSQNLKKDLMRKIDFQNIINLGKGILYNYLFVYIYFYYYLMKGLGKVVMVEFM